MYGSNLFPAKFRVKFSSGSSLDVIGCLFFWELLRLRGWSLCWGYGMVGRNFAIWTSWDVWGNFRV